MTKTFWIGAIGAAFCIGVIFGWMLGGDPELSQEHVRTTVDTLIVKDTVIETRTDTLKTKPVEVWRSRIVRDTLRDTVYAEAVRYNQYSVEKTFSDSAWVKHTFGIEKANWILGFNEWDYRKPPQRIILQVDTVKVYPKKTEKLIKGAMWMVTGGGIAAVIANNTD